MRSFLRPSRPVFACGTLALALLAWPATAAGVAPGDASPEQKSAAMTHFTAGKHALEEKNWDKATLELRASLDVVNSPNARLELARTLRDAGHDADAWTEYGRVAADATKLSATEPRYTQTADAAKSESAALEPKLAFVTVTLAHAPEGATLKVGGRQVPSDQWGGPMVVSPGAVDIVLSDAGGKELARQTVSATVGERAPVTLDAQPPPPPKPGAPDPDDKPDLSQPKAETAASPSDRSKLRPYAYVAGGVGVVGLGLFTAFGLMDNSTYKNLQGACPNNQCPASRQSDIDSGKSQQTVANVGLVVGVLGLAAGGTLFVLSLGSKSTPAATTGLVIAPSYLGLRGSL
ncbi:MAG TPA: tetratricopeptide repeat protein [Polyangiaceae bacterium]